MQNTEHKSKADDTGKRYKFMLKKYYTFTSDHFDELNCFSADEIYLLLMCEKFSEAKSIAIADLVRTMSPLDYLFFYNDDAIKVSIRCWTNDND